MSSIHAFSAAVSSEKSLRILSPPPRNPSLILMMALAFLLVSLILREFVYPSQTATAGGTKAPAFSRCSRQTLFVSTESWSVCLMASSLFPDIRKLPTYIYDVKYCCQKKAPKLLSGLAKKMAPGPCCCHERPPAPPLIFFFNSSNRAQVSMATGMIGKKAIKM